ncbi:uncharacterized protein LOC108940384 [Scleropages formosus]|uniref:uncharacterized protein LOC108940384 n=1 Tax=Scleropages formosus TaxID=113540 RepID=UPI00087852E2|nr:uncharacterized protein LOC108940384 [Scleropages formosus]
MVGNAQSWTRVFVATCLLWVAGAAAQKVYFECGAVVDVVDDQGLILSPGFPYNYSSGAHCVWQFFVPVGYQLVLEMFDFDVYENHQSPAKYVSGTHADEDAHNSTSPARRDAAVDYVPIAKEPFFPAQEGTVKPLQAFQKNDIKHLVMQEKSAKMEMAKVPNWAKWSADVPSARPLHLRPADVTDRRHVSPEGFGGEADPNPTRPTRQAAQTPPSDTGAETQQPVVDACPHDVLYISDLITFSSRFCGSNSPTGQRMVFGSPEEMVEVIMELITTTHWGRGFALLFRYHNHTDAEDRRLNALATGRMDTLLTALGGVTFFALVLTSALCIIFRPKLCAKGAATCSPNSSELQGDMPSTGTDAGELQLVVPSYTGVPVCAESRIIGNPGNVKRSFSLPHTDSGLVGSGGADPSHNAELELSPGGLTELDLGTDEVFVIPSGPAPSGPPLCPHTRDRFLRHSDTALPARAESAGGTRPRAWSVRTFQDLLQPLPQLQRKWCSWNSTSPFTKLVDSAPATTALGCSSDGSRKIILDSHLEGKANGQHDDSGRSSASTLLTQPPQRQRRLNSIGNMRRSRFASPCFSFLSGSPDGGAAAPTVPSKGAPSVPANGSLCPTVQAEVEAHVQAGAPVFAISEEEDRQPLVPSEHLAQATLLNGALWGSHNQGNVSSCLGPYPAVAPGDARAAFAQSAVKLKEAQLQPVSKSPAAVSSSVAVKGM